MLKLILAPRCHPNETNAKDNPSYFVDGARAINNAVGENGAGNVEMAAIAREEENKSGSKEQRSLTQPRISNVNRYSQNPINMNNAECFYIEFGMTVRRRMTVKQLRTNQIRWNLQRKSKLMQLMAK
jgi:hypothetical protein